MAIPRAWLDNRDRLAEALREDTLPRTFVLKNSSHAPQVLGDSLDKALVVAHTLSFVRYKKEGKAVSNDLLQAMCIGECLFPALPAGMYKDQAGADALLMGLARYAFEVNNAGMFQGITRLAYIQSHNLAQRREANPNNEDEGDEEPPAAPQPGQPPVPGVRLIPETTSLEDLMKDHFMSVWLWVKLQLRGVVALNSASAYVALFLAIAKRGNINPTKLDSVSQEVGDVTGLQINVSEDLIRDIYRLYGAHITEANVGDILGRWIDDVGVATIRMKLILQQAAGSGMTSYIVIGRALLKYPNFNWEFIERKTRELTNFRNAVTAVNGNQYYGFKRDVGPVKSANYSNLAWAAKELLIRCNGETSLKSYAGWRRRPQIPQLEDMITEFVEAFKNDEDIAPNEEETRDKENLIAFIGEAVHIPLFR